MRFILYSVAANFVIEYLLTLTNLSVANSPMRFPSPYEHYPCTYDGTKMNCPTSADQQEYPFPWFMRFDFLRENLDWALFFSIDVQFFKINDMWFDFTNLLLMTIYFYQFGNQSR